MLEGQVPPVHPRPLAELLEQLDALPNQRQLLRVVELEAEGTGRDRGGEGRQAWSRLEHHRTQSRPRCVERRRGADDAATDDSHIDRPRGLRLVSDVHALASGHASVPVVTHHIVARPHPDR